MHEANRGRQWLRRSSVFVAAALVGATGLSLTPSTVTAAGLGSPAFTQASLAGSLCGTYATTEFGPNVCVFTPPGGRSAAAELAAIQTVANNIAIQMVPLTAQFADDGYALLFEPGTYGSATTPLVFQVGYYTEVAGLGGVPQDTIINGQIEVFPNALDSEPGPGNCFVGAGQTCYWANSTVNFWRSLSDLTLNVENTANSYVPTPLSMQGTIGDGNCFGGNTDFWSVSQATPVRSVIINGNLDFQSYCSETNYQSNNYGSGSYVANSEINGQLEWSGNQQGIARNSDFQSTSGYVWNYVYSGDACPPGYTPASTAGGVTVPSPACAPTEDAFNGSYDIGNWAINPCPYPYGPCATPGVPNAGGPPGTDGISGINQVTALAQSPVSQEEPFLYTDSTGTNWGAFLPAVQHNSVGPNFVNGSETGTSDPLSSFFVASPSTPEYQVQAALDAAQNLILTPGTYDLNTALMVNHPDTVVLGVGFPVLVPQRGGAAMIVLPNNGVKLSGMIFDAGPVNSPVLLSVGTPGFGWGGRWAGSNSANDPDLIQDTFFRIGGAETTAVSATVSLLDNASNSIIDDVWAWRADHGNNTKVTGSGGEVGAGWTYNQADTGVVVTGDNVTSYGLAVEHYQKNEVIWSGNNGTSVFFQNELPYDPPSQAAWEASPVQPGYPSFLVTNNVQSFHGYGMASYVVFINTPATLWDAAAFEAPNNPGVAFTDTLGLFISSTCSVNGTCATGCTGGSCTSPGQSGGLDSVIDGVGGSATNANPTTPVDVLSYSNGNAVLPTH
jgi:hypothetical protein